MEARRLQEDDATPLATEFNADLAGIVWTLEALFDESSELHEMIKESEALLPGITTATGLGGILSFVIAILAKTLRNSQRAKLRHPKPSFRVEAFRRAVVWFLKTNKKDAELDSFRRIFPVAVDFVVPNLRPTVTDFTQAHPDESGDLPSRVQQAWRQCEPFLEKHMKGQTICFREEMHYWTKTLDW